MKKSIRSQFARYSILLSIAILSFNMQGSDLKTYQVELIIFEHLNQAQSPEGEQRIEMNMEVYPGLRSLNIVDKADLVMSDDAQRIRGSRNFRLLKHFAWTQQGLAKEEAGSVDIGRWVSGFNGTVTLYLSRYLHLDFLVEKLNSENQNRILKERRRLRSNETHYIDHPEFGILARITPVTGQSSGTAE